MINPPSLAIREILEATLLIVARHIPETRKPAQEDDSDVMERRPSFDVSGHGLSEA